MSKYKKIFLDGVIFSNPTFVLVLGTLSHFSSRLEERRQSENTAAKEQTNTASFAPAQLHQLKERSGR